MRDLNNRYDYREHVRLDIREYILDEGIVVTEDNREELEEELRDTLWCTDSVTGNASGSYTFNRYSAELNVEDNWDLLIEALGSLGYDSAYLGDRIIDGYWEDLDVLIRCYLLDECLSDVLDELEV